MSALLYVFFGGLDVISSLNISSDSSQALWAIAQFRGSWCARYDEQLHVHLDLLYTI